MLINDELTIREALPSDAALLGEWWRDGEVMQFSGYPHGLVITDEKIEKQILSCSDDTFKLLIIEVAGNPIGEMSYHNMGDIGGKTAQIGIKICNASMREKGYGTRFLLMLADELFAVEDFMRIILEVDPENYRARYVFEKIGFKEKNIRQDSWINQVGELCSAVDYELKRDDFFANSGAVL